MSFIKNIWYVAAWSTELADQPIGRTIIGEPVVLYRQADGAPVAMEDRCPHRHAPLSKGRVQDGDIQCMYHGLKFGSDGVCKFVPGGDLIPPHSSTRVFPCVEKSSWIWVWLGDPELADVLELPDATGLDNPDWLMREGALDYAANYELINDNLADLSHLDFVHEQTLRFSSGTSWIAEQPKVTPIENGIRIQRWLVDHPMFPGSTDKVDTWSTYDYLLPGLFLMLTEQFPAGTVTNVNAGPPTTKPLLRRIEQQAVTPIDECRTRYLFATGVESTWTDLNFLEGFFKIVNAAFAEDKAMIEAQQQIWTATSADRQKAFIPQDKAPSMFRRLIAQRLKDELA